MQLGFVSAILPEISFKKVIAYTAEMGYDCVEVMCWPKGKASRRYAGVTHINVANLTKKEAKQIKRLCESKRVFISGLGYYPNPLTGDKKAREIYSNHIKKAIDAAVLLGVKNVNTFIGRDASKTIEENWSMFLSVWQPIIAYAERHKVKIGIENCPMKFTKDEWPGGNNLAVSPQVWQKMFEAIPSEYFGLNYDPSHMLLQQMDYLTPMREFAHKLFHIHAKDLRIDRHKLDRVGVFAHPNLWHTPKLPGLGDVNWGQFVATLHDVGYDGPVCVEIEDRAFEGDLDNRLLSLRQSCFYLRQFLLQDDKKGLGE